MKEAPDPNRTETPRIGGGGEFPTFGLLMRRDASRRIGFRFRYGLPARADSVLPYSASIQAITKWPQVGIYQYVGYYNNYANARPNEAVMGS